MLCYVTSVAYLLRLQGWNEHAVCDLTFDLRYGEKLFVVQNDLKFAHRIWFGICEHRCRRSQAHPVSFATVVVCCHDMYQSRCARMSSSSLRTTPSSCSTLLTTRGSPRQMTCAWTVSRLSLHVDELHDSRCQAMAASSCWLCVALSLFDNAGRTEQPFYGGTAAPGRRRTGRQGQWGRYRSCQIWRESISWQPMPLSAGHLLHDWGDTSHAQTEVDRCVIWDQAADV